MLRIYRESNRWVGIKVEVLEEEGFLKAGSVRPSEKKIWELGLSSIEQKAKTSRKAEK